jgi:hypothetical protein
MNTGRKHNGRVAEAHGLSAMGVSGEAERLRPVESAPKDGSFFLFVGSNFDGGMAVVQWDTGMDWWTLDDGKNPEIPLRHEAKLEGWLPLPRFARQALNSAPESR